MRLPITLLFTFLLASVVAMPIGAQEAMREISATITYRQRIALPEDAQVVYELRSNEGDLILEDAFPTSGKQVPIGFIFGIPKNQDLNLRSAIFVGGQPAWLSDPVAIPAGSDPLNLEPIILNQNEPMGFASSWICGDTAITLGFIGENGARLLINNRFIDLEQDRTASGSRFSSSKEPGTWIWTKGNELTINVAGVNPGACREATDEPPVTLRARGNEPGWLVTAQGNTITLLLRNGDETRTASLPEPQVEGISRKYIMPDAKAELVVTDGVCHDTMSGMPYPASAVLQVEGEKMTGCAGEPSALLAGDEWSVEDIKSDDIIESSRITINFEDGKIAGTNGCNRYFGGYQLTGESLSIKVAGSTMMACPEALMKQGDHFLEVLENVTGFTVGNDGALQLTASEKPVITLRR